MRPGMLDDKVVIVTGAGRKRGIGRAIALRLAQDGAHVVVSSQRRDPATFPENEKAEGWLGVRSLAEEIRALGRRAVAVDCDVTRADQVVIRRRGSGLGRRRSAARSAARYQRRDSDEE